MEIFSKIFMKIHKESTDENIVKKSNPILYWTYSNEEKCKDWDEIKKIWFYINGEDYNANGALPTIKKSMKKEEESKSEVRHLDMRKSKIDEKKSVRDKMKEEEKIRILNLQIDELKKKLDQSSSSPKMIVEPKPIYIINYSPLKTWNMRLIKSFEIEGCCATCFAIDNENKRLIAGTESGLIKLFNLDNLELDKEFFSNKNIIEILYLNDATTFLSVDAEGGIMKFDVITEEIKIVSHKLDHGASSATYILDGKTIYVSSGPNLYAFDVNANQIIPDKFKSYEFISISKVFYVKEVRLLVLGFENGNVKLVNPSNNIVVAEFQDHKSKITCLSSVKIKGEISIVSTSEDKVINFYSASAKTLLKTLKVASSRTTFPASMLLYGHDEKTLFTTHDDGKIVLNNFNTGDLENEQTTKYLSSAAEKITAAIYLGDGSHLVVATIEGKIEVYSN